MFARALHTSLHQNENTTKNIEKWWRETCWSIAWCFANVLMSPRNPLKFSCQIIRPHQTFQAIAVEFFQKHLQQIPPSLSLAVEKVQVIEIITSAKPWSAAATFRRHGGTVDPEAAAAIPAENVHSIGHVAPYRCVAPADCGRRSARRQLTPAIGLAKVAQASIGLRWLRKIQSRFWLFKEGVVQLPAIYPNSCSSSFLTSHWSKLTLRWVEMQSQPQKSRNMLRLWKSYSSRAGQAGSGSLKGKRTISQRKTSPIESFVTTLIDLLMMIRTKLASIRFVAARNCMQVCDSKI